MKKKVSILLVFLIIVLPYFLCHGETEILDENFRKQSSEKFVRLKDGFTRYDEAGAENREALVLVHGFSTPYPIWDKNFSELSRHFHVFRYDLYGRGFSDRPDLKYDENLFTSQLEDFVKEMKLDKFHLAGVSMGGAIAVHFANRHPEMIEKLILIDPAGMPMNVGLLGKLTRLPLLGEYMINVFGNLSFKSGFKSNFYNEIDYSDLQKKYISQLVYKGYKRAILSTIRYMPLDRMENEYADLGKKDIPVLLIWGKQDTVIPFENAAKIQAHIPRLKLLSVDSCGHTPQYEKPEIINPALIEFLQGKSLH